MLKFSPLAGLLSSSAEFDRSFSAELSGSKTFVAMNAAVQPENGTSGNDFFGGTSGDDTYSGGEGDDTIQDGGGGNDVLNGDGGNDIIRIQRFGGTRNDVTVNAGEGNDSVYIDASTGGLFTIDLGPGDDLISTFRDGTYSTDITLGAGVDRVEFSSFVGLTFRDFTPGHAGDIFEFSSIQFRAVGYDSSQDPFAAGYLTLTQDGADSILTFFRFGGATGEQLVIGTFQNTAIADFTAHNFNGFDPAAGGPGETITGTEDDDVLEGTAAGDTISGLGGSDTIDGDDGDDDIDGGAGSDTITGGFGDDTIRGGEGDDEITDAFGANTIYGDGGNDVINITGYFGGSMTAGPQRIFGGDGNDTVLWGLNASDSLVLDLGEGDDRVEFIYPIGATSLTLGLGSDIVDVNGIQSIDTTNPITITDFQTGDAGDRLLWNDWIRQETGTFGDPDFNPFSFNETELVQVGDDVHLVWTVREINNSSTLFIFENTQVADFTAFNLEFDPHAPTPPGDDYTGTEDDDDYTGTNLDDTARGLGGRDDLNGRAGDDLLDGGDGDDRLIGDAGNDTLLGGAGDDLILGGAGADTIDGGDGNDEISAGFGDDIIDGGAGDDTINFSGSNDIYSGGDGFDTLEIFGGFNGLAEALDLDLTNYLVDGSFRIGGNLVTDIEALEYLGDGSNFDDRIIYGPNYTFGVDIRGLNGNDDLTAGNGDDFIDGGDGNDTLNGLGGNDVIEDFLGNNVIDGGDGDDQILTGSGDDVILGGAGNDTIDAGTGTDSIDAGEGDDIVTIDSLDPLDDIDGGAGTDTIRIGNGSAPLDLEFTAIDGDSSPIRNFEIFEFTFSFGDDRLILGPTFADVVDLNALEGNDVIVGGTADDTIRGGDGEDVIYGGEGDDELIGGNFSSETGDYDELYGEAGNDSLSGSGLLDGGEGDDFVSGTGELTGGAGNDTINSFGDGDIVRGGAGFDRIALRGASATVLLEAGVNADDIDGSPGGFFTIQATADDTVLRWTAPLEQDPTRGVAIVEGIDVISDGGFANLRIEGSELDDEISLSVTNNVTTIEGEAPIYGLGGNDRITGSGSNDLIYGGEGDDQLDGAGGDNVIHGGLGDDRITVHSSNDVVVELAGEGNDRVIAMVDYTLGAHIEALELAEFGSAVAGTGNDQNNTILGNSASNELYGLGGNDYIEGRSGNDLLDGGLGNDWLVGGEGDDFLIDFNGFNILEGGVGNDIIQGDGQLDGGEGDDQLTGGGNDDLLIGGNGINTIDGGGGNDTVSYAFAFDGVRIDLSSTIQQDTFGGGLDTITNVENVIGSSFDDILRGNDGANILTGSQGNDELHGGANVDTAIFSGDLSQYTVVQFTDRSFGVIGPDGEDRLFGIEFAQFDDQTLRLLPGTGVTVNFDTADPSVYQSALEGLRDFDGNDLGGDGFWLRIGSADVNGDGDVDQILVNDAIGRFATVGTADDGLVYFEDHGWAGETRVAGIYIDPLVQSGDVVQGSDNDSQRRFQNDLEIENINRVLGADDYDGDGIWEVYFALTDGTAYLRALMHEDGNIRYANYQSEQEVIDYLTANGYDESTYGDWFTSGSESASEPLTFVNRTDKAGPADGFEMLPSLAAQFTDELASEFYG